MAFLTQILVLVIDHWLDCLSEKNRVKNIKYVLFLCLMFMVFLFLLFCYQKHYQKHYQIQHNDNTTSSKCVVCKLTNNTCSQGSSIRFLCCTIQTSTCHPSILQRMISAIETEIIITKDMCLFE